MKRITITACAALFLIACNNSGDNHDDHKDSLNKDTTMTKGTSMEMPDSATMMKNWQEYSTPGEPHKMMASWNGTWDGEVTMYMDPAAPPMKSTATTVNKTVMGGRYQVAEHKGNMMGQPFEGMSTLAYDNFKKTFISTWIDNMGTGLMTMEGTWDDASKMLTLKGKGMDPGRKVECDMRETFKMIDDNTQLLEMFGPGPDGKEMKVMEIKYTRKK
jgi:hypothetical protein